MLLKSERGVLPEFVKEHAAALSQVGFTVELLGQPDEAFAELVDRHISWCEIGVEQRA